MLPYFLSKKSCPSLYSKLQYKMAQDFYDMQYSIEAADGSEMNWIKEKKTTWRGLVSLGPLKVVKTLIYSQYVLRYDIRTK